ncbi:MAG: patatin-like phospholipase family protein [Gammaproteobacteria bacterium]|nr:patatin-like phospholipase family protein [Gammaproteobacteria bacterium]
MTATPTLHAWLSARPFTLSLSSGFFGFFAHAGMLAALEERGLKPARLTGASAGALIAGCHAAGLDSAALKDILFGLTRERFWDPGLGLGLLKGEKFRRHLAETLPVQDFAQCAIPLALSVYDAKSRNTRVLREGSLVAAIYASSALPFLFQPLRHEGMLLMDGGIRDRPALAGTIPGERVFYHHIASRSPWRRRNSPALALPQRPNLVGLAIDGLPRSGPNRLDAGREAYALALDTTRRALELPAAGGVIRLPATGQPA